MIFIILFKDLFYFYLCACVSACVSICQHFSSLSGSLRFNLPDTYFICLVNYWGYGFILIVNNVNVSTLSSHIIILSHTYTLGCGWFLVACSLTWWFLQNPAYHIHFHTLRPSCNHAAYVSAPSGELPRSQFTHPKLILLSLAPIGKLVCQLREPSLESHLHTLLVTARLESSQLHNQKSLLRVWMTDLSVLHMWSEISKFRKQQK